MKSMNRKIAEGAKPYRGQPLFFMAQWCGYCKQAKRYLAEKGISYREYDIDTADGMRAFVEAGETRGVPVMFAPASGGRGSASRGTTPWLRAGGRGPALSRARRAGGCQPRYPARSLTRPQMEHVCEWHGTGKTAFRGAEPLGSRARGTRV